MYKYIEVNDSKYSHKTRTVDREQQSARDINRIMKLFGNWASSDESGLSYKHVSSIFVAQSARKSVEMLSDNDAIIIDGILSRMSKIDTERARDDLTVLELYYIKHYSERKIAHTLNTSDRTVSSIRQRAEGFIEGCLCMLNITLDCEYHKLYSVNDENYC